MTVEADIEVNLSKFVGKPMYCTSTVQALQNCQTPDNTVLKALGFQYCITGVASRRKGIGDAYRYLLTDIS